MEMPMYQSVYIYIQKGKLGEIYGIFYMGSGDIFICAKTTVKLENSSKVEEKQQGRRRTVKLENNSKSGE
jgi:hypothetical protein